MSSPISALQVESCRTDRIDLWFGYYDDILLQYADSQLRAYLSEEELSHEQRFYFADDRRRYLVTRAMVRLLLSRYAEVAPTHWRFQSGRFGRPEIANALAQRPCFNISHTRGLVVIGITGRHKLGVDVENLLARKPSIAIAERFFAPAEARQLAKLPPEQRRQRFFDYWTLKEAYIKARSQGMSIALDKFEFRFGEGRDVELYTDASLSDPASGWRFWQYRVSPGFLLALCSENSNIDGPVVTARRFGFADPDSYANMTLLRESNRPCTTVH